VSRDPIDHADIAPPSRYERIQPQAKERTAKLPPNRVTFLNGPNRDFPKRRRHRAIESNWKCESSWIPGEAHLAKRWRASRPAEQTAL
jgi:hypothetical protein